MSWQESLSNQDTETKEVAKAETDVQATEPEGDKPQNDSNPPEQKAEDATPAKDDPKTPDNADNDDKTDPDTGDDAKKTSADADDHMVPQRVVGKALKKLREKSRGEIDTKDQRIRELEAENAALKGSQGNGKTPSWDDNDNSDETHTVDEKLIEKKVRDQMLIQLDAKARRDHGQHYVDCLDLVQANGDPTVFDRIKNSADPVKTLFDEAENIAERVEYGDNVSERKKRQEAELREKIRKEVEAELMQKLEGKNKQPTDVQNVRAAGGDAQPKKIDTWSTSLPS